MKAIRIHQFGNPDVLQLETLPDPTPTSNQVLVRITAVGVNPVETYIRAGAYGPRQFPFTPGTDAAGTVQAIGPNVTHCRPDDSVYLTGSLTGTYADLALCDAADVRLLPPNLTAEQGAAIGVPLATAYYALHLRGHAAAGETALIHGATGAVGLAALQLAQLAQLHVIATAGSADGLRFLADQGAALTLNHHDEHHWQAVLQHTNGSGVPLILEMLANVNLARDLEILAQRGRVVVIGSRGTVTIDPRNTMQRDADIRGMSLHNATAQQKQEIYTALDQHLRAGALQPVIAQRFPLAQAPAAHTAVRDSHAPGKIVLIP